MGRRKHVTISIKDDDLSRQIKQVALERFTHFGIEKTTMYEIVQSVGITPTVMASYFPNKQELLTTLVKEKIKDENEQLSRCLNKSTPVLQALFNFLEIKSKISKLQLVHNRGKLFKGVPETIVNMIRTAVIKQLSNIFKKGIDNGELKNLPVSHVAELYLDLLHGIILVMCNKLIPNMDEQTILAKILEQQKAITEMFVSGLRRELT